MISREHLGELGLHELVPAMGFPRTARGASRSRSAVEARHRRADDAPRDAEARLRSGTTAGPSCRDAGQHGVLRHRTSSRISSLVTLARSDSLAVDVARVEALRVRRHEEAAHSSPSSLAQTSATCAIAVGDPALRAVEHVSVAVVARRGRAHAAGFEPKSGSVRPKQPIARPPPSRAGSAASAPPSRTRGSDTSRASPAPRERANARVAALELLQIEPVAGRR